MMVLMIEKANDLKQFEEAVNDVLDEIEAGDYGQAKVKDIKYQCIQTNNYADIVYSAMLMIE